MKSILNIAKDLIKQYSNDPSATGLVANAERIIKESELTANQAIVLNSIKKTLSNKSYFADSIKDVASREGMKVSTVRRIFTQLKAKELLFIVCELRGFWATA